jgi:hypothetical protein
MNKIACPFPEYVFNIAFRTPQVIQERTEELKKRAEERKKIPTAPEDQDIKAFGNKI